MTILSNQDGPCPITRAWNNVQVEVHARALGLVVADEHVAYVHWDAGHYVLKDHHGTILASLWQNDIGDLVATRPGDAA